jgi:hypothetical protein
MKNFRKLILYFTLVILMSNMPLVSEVLSVFFYSAVGPPFCFTTADSGFIE